MFVFCKKQEVIKFKYLEVFIFQLGVNFFHKLFHNFAYLIEFRII